MGFTRNTDENVDDKLQKRRNEHFIENIRETESTDGVCVCMVFAIVPSSVRAYFGKSKSKVRLYYSAL